MSTSSGLVNQARASIIKGMGRSIAQNTALFLVMLLALPFVFYAANFGQSGLRNALSEPHYLFSGNAAANTAIFMHMITGAAVTLLVPLQLIGPIRDRAPRLHRWSGRIIVLTAVVTAIGGLIYIPLRGTIGGAPMNAGFTVYGVLVLTCAVQTIRFAHARRITRHRAWALRLFWLAMGSWFYRVHYALWHLATDGRWSNPEFTGAFDFIQNFAFYLPYLIGVEIYLRRQDKIG